ncbi:MAG: hypothetical protein H7249_10750 [Chitinophagaceae bacterium]|nr:hypothetical protein [Oligoflexus sp.]
MRLSDMPALRKIDQAYHAPFLTACTAALTAHGYLTDTESEQLRIHLKDRHRLAEGGSLFQQLKEENSAAFSILQARLGPYNFSGLLFRWTTAKAIENFNFAIWSFAQELLNKAELMFNQPFHLYSGKTCVQRGPFSYFLVETAGELHKNADELHELVRQLKRWSLRTQVTQSFETSLATHLGFETNDEPGLADWKLHEILKKTWLQLELLAEFNEHVLRQVSANLKMDAEEPRLKFLLEDFQSILMSTRGIAHIDFSAIDTMENKRLRILAALQECRDLAQEFYPLLLDTIKTSRVPSQATNIWSEYESRAIINHLLDRGIPISEARGALAALVSYCHDHGISPEQLLDAELQKIHPFFDNTSSLFLRKASTTDRLSEGFTEEKHQIVRKKDHLLQSINQRLLGITFIFFLLITLTAACGVKTAPRSEVLDVRPTVPYHADSRNYPKKNGDTPTAVQTPPSESK